MISYRPLYDTLIKKRMSTYALFKAGFNSSTYYSMKAGNSVSTYTINHLCEILDCEVSDVMEFIKE